MRDFRNRVAVVTGAASGIGLGLAERFAAEGMKLVLADVEAAALAQAEQSLRSSGADVVAIATDVSQPDQVDRLAKSALRAFGAVHIVCNNAGVVSSSEAALWEVSLADWEWVMAVNFWGVVYGIRSFVPILLEQDAGHVVNTASISGLVAGSAEGNYSASKHAVVSLSESLHVALALRGARVGVSVLCPGWTRTRIADAERNRPERYRSAQAQQPAAADAQDWGRQQLERGTPPREVAAKVVDAIRDERFYVLPHPEWLPLIRERMEDIEYGRPPRVQSPETLLTALGAAQSDSSSAR